MSRSAQQILEDARQLPPSEFDWLILNLLHEGEGEHESEIAAAWEGEIKRRLEEIDSGAVKLISHEEVLADMDAHIAAKQRG
jgi:hypothetical protein